MSVFSTNQVVDPQLLTLSTMVQGRITATQSLDREAIDSYQLILTARDSSANPRVSSIPLRITVLDVNDNSPMFSMPSFNFTLNENTNDTLIMEFNVCSFDTRLMWFSHFYFLSRSLMLTLAVTEWLASTWKHQLDSFLFWRLLAATLWSST